MGVLGRITGTASRVQFIQNQTNTIIQIDASIKENHSRESPATEFPLESGGVISDHIIIKPLTLELTGIVSDNPIGNISQLITEAVTTGLSSTIAPPLGVVGLVSATSLFQADLKSARPMVATYNKLLKLQELALSFDVLTALYRYPDMWITSLSVPREVDSGRALVFNCKLQQLQLVRPQAVAIEIFSNQDLSSKQVDGGDKKPDPGYAKQFKKERIHANGGLDIFGKPVK